jgi:flagellar protein FlbD
LHLTRLGGPVFALNPDLIERAEATPDTVVTLVNGSHFVIRESLAELAELIRDYRASVIARAQELGEHERAGATDPPPVAPVVPLHRGEH